MVKRLEDEPPPHPPLNPPNAAQASCGTVERRIENRKMVATIEPLLEVIIVLSVACIGRVMVALSLAESEDALPWPPPHTLQKRVRKTVISEAVGQRKKIRPTLKTLHSS